MQSHLTAQNIKIPDISKNTLATSSVNNVSYPVKGTRLQVSVAFAKLAVAKVHSKIRRVREDFLHKLSRKTVNENQVIVVENLAVKNMVKNHNLATSISDAGWGMFCTMLKYKAESEGKIYLEVGRFFPSTHLHLGSNTLLPIAKMNLSVREFDCTHCGQRHNRDVNAAINIRNEGLRILALGTSVTAQGGDVRPKRYGCKSTTVEAVAVELGSPYQG